VDDAVKEIPRHVAHQRAEERIDGRGVTPARPREMRKILIAFELELTQRKRAVAVIVRLLILRFALRHRRISRSSSNESFCHSLGLVAAARGIPDSFHLLPRPAFVTIGRVLTSDRYPSSARA